MEVKALQQILTQFRQMQENLQKQVEAVHVDQSLLRVVDFYGSFGHELSYEFHKHIFHF